jgi:hypothetical protein
MKLELKDAPHADYAPLHVRQKPSPWKVQSEKRAKKICTAKRSTHAFMRSICCVASSADSAKKHVRKKQSSSPIALCLHLSHRGEEIFGKDKLVETMDERIDVSKRQRQEVLEFKQGQKTSTQPHLQGCTSKNNRTSLITKEQDLHMLSEYIFWFLSFVAVFSAAGMIFSKNPGLQCVITHRDIFAVAGHYFLLGAISRCGSHHRVCRSHHGSVSVCDHDAQPQ